MDLGRGVLWGLYLLLGYGYGEGLGVSDPENLEN